MKKSLMYAMLWGLGIFLTGLPIVGLLHEFVPSGEQDMAFVTELLSTSNWLFISFSALVWAPLFETLIGQLLPVELLRRAGAQHAVILLACGAVFGLGHFFTNGLAHALRAGAAGVLLGELYCRHRAESVSRSYAMVATAHATTNLCVLIAWGARDFSLS